MEMNEKIKYLRKQHGLTLEDVGNVVGVGKSTVRKWENGDIANMRRDKIGKLAEALHTTPAYLMGWDDTAVHNDSIVSFPLLVNVAAGYDHMAVPADAEIVDIPRQYLRGRPASDYFLMRVIGSSMYPLYQDGDIVLVLKQATMNRSGEIGVVIYDDESATLKKIEYVEGEDWMRLVPVNPSYEPVMVTDERLEHCRVIGIPRLLIRRVSE